MPLVTGAKNTDDITSKNNNKNFITDYFSNQNFTNFSSPHVLDKSKPTTSAPGVCVVESSAPGTTVGDSGASVGGPADIGASVSMLVYPLEPLEVDKVPVGPTLRSLVPLPPLPPDLEPLVYQEPL